VAPAPLALLGARCTRFGQWMSLFAWPVRSKWALDCRLVTGGAGGLWPGEAVLLMSALGRVNERPAQELEGGGEI